MADADALVIMKIGRNMPKVRRALEQAGKLARAIVVEFAAMPGQTVTPLVDLSPDHPAPYFSIVVVHGQGRRP